jgi:hypothetical protein
MELLPLPVVLIRAVQGVTLMLFLVALVVTQVLHLFHLAQLTHHHQVQSLFQVVQKLVDHTELTDLVLMELNIQQELVAEILDVQQLGLELAVHLGVVIMDLGDLQAWLAFKKELGHV